MREGDRKRERAKVACPLYNSALLVRNCETLSLVELGELLKRDLSGLSQAARRIERRIGTDSLLAIKLEKVSRSLRISDCQA